MTLTITLTPALLQVARTWISECTWEEDYWADNWIEELSPREIEQGIERNYEGGLRQFTSDASIGERKE